MRISALPATRLSRVGVCGWCRCERVAHVGVSWFDQYSSPLGLRVLDPIESGAHGFEVALDHAHAARTVPAFGEGLVGVGHCFCQVGNGFIHRRYGIADVRQGNN